jgi:hypothetical protein
MRRLGIGSQVPYLTDGTNKYGSETMKSFMIILLTLVVSTAQADERFWCLDQASSGYILDPRREVGNDKSKPQNFFGTHTAMRLSGKNVYLNFQGLGEKEFSCTTDDTVMQCTEDRRFFVFDTKTGNFNFADLRGNMKGSIESLVLRFGVCQPSK